LVPRQPSFDLDQVWGHALLASSGLAQRDVTRCRHEIEETDLASNDNRSRTARCQGAMAAVPAWACLPLAVFAYFALHALALRPQAIVVDPGSVAAIVGACVLGGVLESLQYAVPVLCVSALLLSRVGAAMAAPHAADASPAAAGNGMSTWEYERLTAGGLRVARARGERAAAIA
jgi:hypothetical protein